MCVVRMVVVVTTVFLLTVEAAVLFWTTGFETTDFGVLLTAGKFGLADGVGVVGNGTKVIVGVGVGLAEMLTV